VRKALRPDGRVVIPRFELFDLARPEFVPEHIGGEAGLRRDLSCVRFGLRVIAPAPDAYVAVVLVVSLGPPSAIHHRGT